MIPKKKMGQPTCLDLLCTVNVLIGKLKLD